MVAATHNEIFQRFLAEIEAQSVDESLASKIYVDQWRQLKEDARARSKFEFLRWPGLDAFSIPENWVPAACYYDLRNSLDWDERWFRLTRDSKVGASKDWSIDFGTSPALVQHTYHLFRYEKATGRSLLDCDLIFEVGGGYGSFCRLLQSAGFSGLHIIYDLPHVSSIQRLYLSLLGLQELPPAEIGKLKTHRFCLLTHQYFDVAIERILESSESRVGFVATWSLSEMPLAVRERIMAPLGKRCVQYLIAFQPAWGTINNTDYFRNLREARPDLKWREEQMPRIVSPPSLYLFA